MASVTSLDKDLRKLRLEKYTPAAANEARAWIEDILGERLPSSDLLEGLKDGVALCKLVNLAVPPPGVKFKQSSMPFVQMENISHFLRACQAPPLNLHQHDTFLTVDLFEQKDPAQVLQCIGAFSRAANAVNPRSFPTSIGPKTTRSGVVTPQGTGTASGSQTGLRNRNPSIASNSSSGYGGASKSALSHLTGDASSDRWSPTKSPGSPVSTWSRREQEGSTAPAWNIAQYGYMGGASQGNLGIAFGVRRQITNSGPHVPTLTEKERVRKEKIAEEERQRQEIEARRRADLEAEERARLDEERRWEEETQRLREQERRKVEEERRLWEEQERQWKLTEENRRKEEEEAAARVEEERRRARTRSPVKLRGQYLSQYRAEQANADDAEPEQTTHRNRIKELERELEQARQREAEYERERQGRASNLVVADQSAAKLRARSRSRPGEPRSPRPNNSQNLNRQESWTHGGEVLQTKWKQHQEDLLEDELEAATSPPSSKSPRPLPDPKAVAQVKTHNTGGRPLPDPAKYASPPRNAAAAAATATSTSTTTTTTTTTNPSPQNRTDRFLVSNPAPVQAVAQQTYARELGATEERDTEDRRRIESQEKTKAAGWASKSLLEREMEMERQRQKEWEEAQKQTAAARRSDVGVDGIGGGIGGRWDVSQWSGYAGGDSQNKGSQGIGAGRRQIVGPRPLPSPGR